MLGLNVGRFDPGQQFDAIVVETGSPGSALRSWSGIDDYARVFEKGVGGTLGDDHDGFLE